MRVTNRPEVNNQRPMNVTCCNCERTGHFARECRGKKNNNGGGGNGENCGGPNGIKWFFNREFQQSTEETQFS